MLREKYSFKHLAAADFARKRTHLRRTKDFLSQNASRIKFVKFCFNILLKIPIRDCLVDVHDGFFLFWFRLLFFLCTNLYFSKNQVFFFNQWV